MILGGVGGEEVIERIHVYWNTLSFLLNRNNIFYPIELNEY